MRLAVACAFAALVAVAAFRGTLPPAVPLLYAAASATTFTVYRIDERAAVRGAHRTPEDTLLAASLLGGWPGALVAQQTLRHKSRKASFQLLFWVTVAINRAVLAWFALV